VLGWRRGEREDGDGTVEDASQVTRPGSVRARRIEVTDEIRAADTLAEPDYGAAWEVPLEGGPTRSAEQWARATLEDAPRALRGFIVAGWVTVLGLRLGPRPSPDHILGWRYETNAADHIILEEQFRFGTAHNMVRVDGARVLFATFVRYDKWEGRPLWAIVAPLHHRIIPYLLGRAASHAKHPRNP
jgi:Protein of unknown function (DUF2867)